MGEILHEPLAKPKEKPRPNERRLHRGRRLMAEVGIATVLGIAGGLGVNQIVNHGTDSENIPAIEQVDVSKDGLIEKMNLGSEDDPFEIVSARGTTVVAIEKTEGDKILLGVSVPGEKIGKKNIIEYVDGGTSEIPTESYSGITIWFKLTENVSILNDNYFPDVLGKGSEQVLQYIKVGDEIGGIDVNLSYLENWGISPEEVEENKQSLEKMNSNVDKTHPTSDRSFIFNANSVFIASPELQTP